MVSEKIRLICAKLNISQAELARRCGTSPQNLSAKMKRDSFTLSELSRIAEILDIKMTLTFLFADGTEI